MYYLNVDRSLSKRFSFKITERQQTPIELQNGNLNQALIGRAKGMQACEISRNSIPIATVANLRSDFDHHKSYHISVQMLETRRIFDPIEDVTLVRFL